jgi:predicted Zn-dependent protease
MHQRKTLKLCLDKIFAQEKTEISWLGFRYVREKTSGYAAKDGKPQSNEVDHSHGIMIEVLTEGQFGYAATSNLDFDALKAATQRAKQQALAAAPFALAKFTEQQRPPCVQDYPSKAESPFSNFSAQEINHLLLKISDQLHLSPKIVRRVAQARAVESEVLFLSSNGSDACQNFSFAHTSFEATAQDGLIIQKRTDTDHSRQGGWEHFLNHDLWDRVQKVGEQALELLEAPECPSETTSLVIMPDQMMLQIHESIGHPLELDRILGDERNFAGWSFVQSSDFGSLEYGSSLMNVSFDPTPPTEFASYAFDDVGAASQREYLIQNGILIRGLGGLESQSRSHLPGVANSRACSWNRPPIDRMANINLEPGASSLAEIVSSVERGILVESNRSWSIDDFRNKFQFGCEYGRLIRDGVIGATVRNPNYRGVTIPFWKSLKKVGNKESVGMHGLPNCGKGEPNQTIRVGHASPVCLFEKVEVFGGTS